MNISIIGCGYVGLVTGACFAELGHKVVCVDSNSKKIKDLKKNILPIYEPGLDVLISTNTKKKRLVFSCDMKSAVCASDIIFIAVGTPSLGNGEADLTYIESVARNIAAYLDSDKKNTGRFRLIVEKSTVPVETGFWVKKTITANLKNSVKFDVASNPEFIREGQAIQDFMHPDRIVIGVESCQAKELLLKLYRPLKSRMVITDIKSAELIKHASNSFLAAKISFINAISNICDKVGADVSQVAQGMGLDKRISPAFLDAGIGYGGSCFPKDLDAFINISAKIGYNFEFLKAVKLVNEQQKEVFLKKVKDILWIIKDKTIAVLGLSFKPNTDDVRNSPALDIVKMLQSEGAVIKAYDPQAMPKVKNVLKGVKICKNAYDACRGSDCLVIMTGWDEFRTLDFKKVKKLLKRPLVIDGRNIYDIKYLEKLGFSYVSMGRPSHLKKS